MPAFLLLRKRLPFERTQNVLCMFFIVNFVLFNVDIVLLTDLDACCNPFSQISRCVVVLMAASQLMKMNCTW